MTSLAPTPSTNVEPLRPVQDLPPQDLPPAASVAGAHRRAPEPVDRWSLQIYSTDGDRNFDIAIAMLDLALIEVPHRIEESTDGVRQFLIVETPDDPATIFAVHAAVTTADSAALLEQRTTPARDTAAPDAPVSVAEPLDQAS